MALTPLVMGIMTELGVAEDDLHSKTLAAVKHNLNSFLELGEHVMHWARSDNGFAALGYRPPEPQPPVPPALTVETQTKSRLSASPAPSVSSSASTVVQRGNDADRFSPFNCHELLNTLESPNTYSIPPLNIGRNNSPASSLYSTPSPSPIGTRRIVSLKRSREDPFPLSTVQEDDESNGMVIDKERDPESETPAKKRVKFDLSHSSDIKPGPAHIASFTIPHDIRKRSITFPFALPDNFPLPDALRIRVDPVPSDPKGTRFLPNQGAEELYSWGFVNLTRDGAIIRLMRDGVAVYWTGANTLTVERVGGLVPIRGMNLSIWAEYDAPETTVE